MKSMNGGYRRVLLFPGALSLLLCIQINKSIGQTLAYNDPHSSISISQNSPAQSTKALTATTLEPVFPGGSDSLHRYLFLHIQTPDSLWKRDVSGNIYFSFMVEADGKIDKVKIVKGVASPGWDSVAIACIRSMPNWKPGSVNDKPKAMGYFLPVFVPPGHELFNMSDSLNIK
jgi:hypothetical protein